MTTLNINAGSGDCFGNTTPTFVSNGTNLYIGADTGPLQCKSWVPFIADIPNAAAILSATLKMKCSVARSGNTCKIKVGCEAADNPANPTTWNDLNGRTLSANYTQDDAVAAWTLGTEYTYDVKAAVQEIVTRAGWAANNTLAILIVDNGSSTGAFREFAAVEHATYAQAVLDVEYEEAVLGVIGPIYELPKEKRRKWWEGWSLKNGVMQPQTGLSI